MEIHKRRIIAYIIGKLVSGNEISRIFDRSSSSFNQIAGEVSMGKINVYDTEKYELMTGSGDKTGISLYDYKSGKFIDLHIYDNEFDGFDFESKKIFYGDVKENIISFFDFQDSKHHYYIMINTDEDFAENLGLLI